MRVTVPVEDVPPVTDVGFRTTPVGVGAFTVSVPFVELPPMVAVIVALVLVDTAEVGIANFTTVVPAATVTVAGTVATLLLDVRFTTVPPAGAADASVTAPSPLCPPKTEDGSTLRVKVAAALSVNVALVVVPLRVAEILPVVLVVSVAAVTVNVAVVAPAATVTLDGTVTPEMAEESATASPPLGAGLVRVTVPVAVLGPVTVVGEIPRLVIVGAATVSVAEPDWLFAEAPIVTDWFEPTATVETVAVPDVAPAAIVTVAGTVAAELLEVRATLSPPVGAGPLIVIVAVDELPPTTDVGFNTTVVTPGPLSVNVPGVETLLAPAVIVTVAADDIGVVATVNVAVVAPAATVTLAGTVAAELFDANFTT